MTFFFVKWQIWCFCKSICSLLETSVLHREKYTCFQNYNMRATLIAMRGIWKCYSLCSLGIIYKTVTAEQCFFCTEINSKIHLSVLETAWIKQHKSMNILFSHLCNWWLVCLLKSWIFHNHMRMFVIYPLSSGAKKATKESVVINFCRKLIPSYRIQVGQAFLYSL